MDYAFVCAVYMFCISLFIIFRIVFIFSFLSFYSMFYTYLIYQPNCKIMMVDGGLLNDCVLLCMFPKLVF